MKKNLETNNNNILVIANSKGGVGKSIVAKILATLGTGKYKNINVYEIDNNNAKGELKSSLINHKVFKINEKSEAIFDV